MNFSGSGWIVVTPRVNTPRAISRSFVFTIERRFLAAGAINRPPLRFAR